MAYGAKRCRGSKNADWTPLRWNVRKSHTKSERPRGSVVVEFDGLNNGLRLTWEASSAKKSVKVGSAEGVGGGGICPKTRNDRRLNNGLRLTWEASSAKKSVNVRVAE